MTNQLTLILVTNNNHKIQEIMALLKDSHILVRGYKDYFQEHIEPEETGSTFEENAITENMFTNIWERV